jgi:hypothetical protein
LALPPTPAHRGFTIQEQLRSGIESNGRHI